MDKILQHSREVTLKKVINQFRRGSLYIAADGDIWVLDRPEGEVVEIFSNTEHFVEEMVKRCFRQIIVESCGYSNEVATNIYYELI